jgi:hypothetical protein
MDTKEKVNEEQECRKQGIDYPFGSFQKMSEMMKDCCKNEAVASDCCSMMARMMRFDKGHEANQEQATEAASKEGQNA